MSTAILIEAEPTIVPPTVDTLSLVSGEALWEVMNGQRVEMPPMSLRASNVAGELYATIRLFAKPGKLGQAFIETLIQVPLPEDEGRNRRPDVCFVSAARLKEANLDDLDVNAWAVVPDLAIEVTSPTDRAEVQREKVQEFLRLGVRCVWVVYPKLGLVDVYEPQGSTRTFGPGGVLPGDPVLPGLEIPLDELFRPIGTLSE
jgi:Uma2 family endonuclease